MKRILILLLTVVLLFSACKSEDVAPEDTITAEETVETAEEMAEEANEIADQAQGIDVDEGLLDVTITLPTDFFDAEDIADFQSEEYLKEEGFKKAEINDDGTVSITMSKKKHNELMDGIRMSMDEAFAELIESEDTPYIKEVNTSDDYKKVEVKVDKAGYESAMFDLTPMMVGMFVMMYQQYGGEEMHCEISMLDADTNEVMSSVVYPDAWNDLEE